MHHLSSILTLNFLKDYDSHSCLSFFLSLLSCSSIRGLSYFHFTLQHLLKLPFLLVSKVLRDHRGFPHSYWILFIPFEIHFLILFCCRQVLYFHHNSLHENRSAVSSKVKNFVQQWVKDVCSFFPSTNCCCNNLFCFQLTPQRQTHRQWICWRMEKQLFTFKSRLRLTLKHALLSCST